MEIVFKTEFGCNIAILISDTKEELGSLEYTIPDELENVFRMQNLLIFKQFRRKGYGTYLINGIKSLCKTLYNSCDIEVDISPLDDEKLEDLVKFYIKNGFIVSEINFLGECEGKFSFG